MTPDYRFTGPVAGMLGDWSWALAVRYAHSGFVCSYAAHTHRVFAIELATLDLPIQDRHRVALNCNGGRS